MGRVGPLPGLPMVCSLVSVQWEDARNRWLRRNLSALVVINTLLVLVDTGFDTYETVLSSIKLSYNNGESEMAGITQI